MFEYKIEKAKVVADALSHKVKLAAISNATGTLLESIKQRMEYDPMARNMIQAAKRSRLIDFWIENSLLYTTGQRVFALKWNKPQYKVGE